MMHKVRLVEKSVNLPLLDLLTQPQSDVFYIHTASRRRSRALQPERTGYKSRANALSEFVMLSRQRFYNNIAHSSAGSWFSGPFDINLR
jgi:hypothetical protein